MTISKLRTNIHELEVQLNEMKIFYQNSEEQRESLKVDLNVQSNKIIDLEEEIYEAKRHYLDIL